jgi:hypothetical protein
MNLVSLVALISFLFLSVEAFDKTFLQLALDVTNHSDIILLSQSMSGGNVVYILFYFSFIAVLHLAKVGNNFVYNPSNSYECSRESSQESSSLLQKKYRFRSDKSQPGTSWRYR